MARRDRFDFLAGGALLVCLVAVALVLAGARPQGNNASQLDKAMEQQMAYQARVEFLRKLYRPVTELREAGQESEALLKLDEIARRYPQEAHGEILRAEILNERGAVKEAIDHYVRAVRLNGDYVDQASPLNRFRQISTVVDAQLPVFSDRARKNPQNLALQNSLTGLYYLQSRLAGGCE